MVNNMNTKKNNLGFTIIEMVIVVAVMGILAAIAIPSYQNHIVDTKRGLMMSELQGLASKISQQKVVQGSYRNIENSSILSADGKYPVSEKDKLYLVKLDDVKTAKWTLTATPLDGTIMEGDGKLTLDYNGRKCHKTKCGMGDEWK